MRSGVQWTMPVRMAIATACARSFAPSFSKIRSRWVFTVWGEIPRSLATCLVVAPSATFWRISRSRLDRGVDFPSVSARWTSSMKVLVS